MQRFSGRESPKWSHFERAKRTTRSPTEPGRGVLLVHLEKRAKRATRTAKDEQREPAWCANFESTTAANNSVQTAADWRRGAAAVELSGSLQGSEASVSEGLSTDPTRVLWRGLRTGVVRGLNTDLCSACFHMFAAVAAKQLGIARRI